MKKLLLFCDRFLQKYLPDPFVVAIFLTVATFGFAIWFRPNGSVEETALEHATTIVKYWGDGFWDLAKFTLQMSMILIGGYVVAVSRPVKGGLLAMIKFVNTPVQAVLFCTFAAIAASWINWGFGLVVGGIVALEVGKKLPHVSFRVLVASSYSGFLVWHAGLSGSIPLALNTEGGFSEKLIGELIPLSSTTFSRFNFVAVTSMLLLLPIVNLLNLWIANEEADGSNNVLAASSNHETTAAVEPENGLNHSFLVVLLLFGMAAFYWYAIWSDNTRSLKVDLNSINLAFFMFGLLLHGTPASFVNAVSEATSKVAPILIQYPLYAAIMATLNESGLAAQISQWFVDHSTATTFPLMTFYSAGLLNLLVPSGGGQWAVQAPIVIGAARELNVDIARVSMAVAWGDAWTNLAQPFWAVPLLTIAGLSIKDIMGFCLVTLVASGLVLSLLFLVF